MRVQLWSYNYAPEPTGIGPVSAVLAKGLRELGHDVEVVAAHPHHPEPQWGARWRPYREVRDGIPVVRLPLWVGADAETSKRRQELSFTAAQVLAIRRLGRPDVRVVVTPSFPALSAAILAKRLTGVPWVMWMQDILTDGVADTDTDRDRRRGLALPLAQRLERAAYADADHIVPVSNVFRRNLLDKGVPPAKLALIYNPASREPRRQPERTKLPVRMLVMGNIGQAQGLAAVVDAFERESAMNDHAVLTITGGGAESDAVRAKIRTGRVVMRGVVSDDELEWELQRANVALITQKPMAAEFNLPSKLMNYMAYGLPVLAVVDPNTEVARIVRSSGAGWLVDASRPAAMNDAINYISYHPRELETRAEASLAYGRAHFLRRGFAATWERTLQTVVKNAASAAGHASPPTPAQPDAAGSTVGSRGGLAGQELH